MRIFRHLTLVAMLSAVGLSMFIVQAISQSQSSRVIVIGEDSDQNAVPRDAEAYSRVVSVLQNAMSEAGYFAVDEQLLSSRLGLEFTKGVRRQDFVTPLQAANATDDPLVHSRLAFVFSIFPIMQDMSMTRQLRVRVRGDIYDLATLRLIRSTEVQSETAKILPLDDQICNSVCIEEAIGEQARNIASELAAELIDALNMITKEQVTYTVLKLNLLGFDRIASIQLMRDISGIKEILATDLLSDDGKKRVYSVTTSKDAGFVEEEVILAMIENGFDPKLIRSTLSTEEITLSLGEISATPLVVIIENFDAQLERDFAEGLMSAYGSTHVSLDQQADGTRRFFISVEETPLNIEKKVGDIVAALGYRPVDFDTEIDGKTVKVSARRFSAGVYTLTLSGKGLDAVKMRETSVELIDEFGSDNVSLQNAEENHREFLITTEKTPLEIEGIVSSMMVSLGFNSDDFALNIDGRNIQIQVARSPDPVFTVLLNLKNVDEAKKAQTALKALGHYTGVIDGLWGRGSVAALRKFKASQSMLPNDDAWDLQTQKALF